MYNILLNLQSLPVTSMYVYLTVGGNDPLEMLFIIGIQKTTYPGFPVFTIVL